MSDIHLEFPFRQKDGSRGKGYTVFDFPKMAPNLALLGDIGLACEDGLFQFLERNLRRFERVFFVMGNHEGYGGSYVRRPYPLIPHCVLTTSSRRRLAKGSISSNHMWIMQEFDQSSNPWATLSSSTAHDTTCQID
jgi:hypothetical protein